MNSYTESIFFKVINGYPSDVLFQVTVGFTFGLVFAPWSYGLIYLLLFFIIYELIYIYLFGDTYFKFNNIIIRLVVIVVSFIGWLIGRVIINDPKPLRDYYDDGYSMVGCNDPINDGIHEFTSIPMSDKENIDKFIIDLLNM